MGRALVALAVLLTLTACSTVAAPEPGLSAAERAVAQDRMRDIYWEISGLPDDQRPPDPTVVTVDPQDYASAFVSCMNEAGYDNYEASGGGYTYSWPEGGEPESATLAKYVCDASMWADSYGGWYNTAQISYLYDYFEQTLVPCLAVYGAQLTEVPTRQQFEDMLGGWHPYLGIRQADHDRVFGDRQVLRDCPPMPAGMPDRGYATLWD